MSDYSKGYKKGSCFFELLTPMLKKQCNDYLILHNLRDNEDFLNGFADALSDWGYSLPSRFEE